MQNKLIKEKMGLLANAGYSKKAINYFINEVNVEMIESADVALS